MAFGIHHRRGGRTIITGSYDTGSWDINPYGTGSYAGMCATGPTLFGTPTQDQLETYCCLWNCGGAWCNGIDCSNYNQQWSTGSYTTSSFGNNNNTKFRKKRRTNGRGNNTTFYRRRR